MTVKDLIEKLQSFDTEHRVFVKDDNGNFSTIESIFLDNNHDLVIETEEIPVENDDDEDDEES